MINAGGVYSELVLNGDKFFDTLNKAEKDMSSFENKMKTAGKSLETAGKSWSTKVTVPIMAIGTVASKIAIDFESAFAGVRKTVDTSEEGFKKLETGIRDMAKEIPASATAIAGVAEAAGQLGIETDNILGFTRVMIDLGESTNMSADEAATSFARFANIVGMSQQDFDRLGSVVVDLGNNLATTEAEIVSMAMRLAGAGSQIGLTEAQIMSFAGSLSSVGIEAEAGGSAFSKVMIDMQLAVETNSKKLNDFADVAGMSGKEFKKAFQDDAAGAIITFIQGLGKSEERGLSAIKVLDDMGITELRLRDALLRASGASDVFTGALEIGSKAWEENNALTKEAEQRYETTASKIEIAKNYLKDAGITAGEIVVPYLVELSQKVKDVSEWFSNLNPETQESIVKMAGFAAAIGPVLLVGGKFAGSIGSIIGLFSKFSGAATVASGATAAVGTGIGTTGTLASAGALLLNPWVLGIAAAGLGAMALAKHLKEDSIPAMEEFDKTISESTREAVTNLLDMEKQATASLNRLSWSGMTVTEEMKDNITSNTNQMADEVITKLEEQKIEGIKHLEEMLGRSTEISAEEAKEAIRIATEKYEVEIKNAQEGKSRIEEILTNAAERNSKITDDERKEIERIIEELKNNSITLTSESKEEQEKILENLKNNADRLTAEMLLDIVNNSKEQKKQTVEQAEQEYQERLRFAETLKKDGSMESSELADNVIKDAEKQRDDAVKAAEEMHEKVLQEVTNQGGDIVKQLDLDNGSIKTKWQELVAWFKQTPLVRKITEFREENSAGTAWSGMKGTGDASEQWGKNMTEMMAKGIESGKPAIESAVDGIARTTEDYLGFQSPTKLGPGSTADKWMPNFVKMLADGINGNASKVKDASNELANKIKDSMSQVNEYVSNTVSIIEKKFNLWQLKNKELKGSSEELTLQIEMQRQKHAVLTDELGVAEIAMTSIIAKYGEGSIEAIKYKNELMGLQIEHQKLTNDINNTAAAMRELAMANTAKLVNGIINKQNAENDFAEVVGRQYLGDSYYDNDDSYDAVWSEIDGKMVPGNSKVGFREVAMKRMAEYEKWKNEGIDNDNINGGWENSDIGKILERNKGKYSITDAEWETMKKIASAQVHGFAHGTNFAPGGLAWVGEQGPELIELPQGSKVHSNQKSMEMAKNTSAVNRKSEIHLHIGTLIADDYGLKQLERKLSNIRIDETVRLGGA